MNRLFIIRNLKKHLWKRNNFFPVVAGVIRVLVLFAAALNSGCGEKSEKKEYVARVNDSFLTQDDLEKLSDTSFKNNFYRSEIIRNWIDEELLYQEALNKGIPEEENFNRIIDISGRELAGVLLLKQVADQYEFTYSEEDLEEFYQTYSAEFKLQDDAFLLNTAEFTDEDKAIEFRTSVLQDEWQKVIELKKYKDVLNKHNRLLLSENEIYPLSVRNILQELFPSELSIVVNIDTSSYKIFQVVEKYPEGTIPPFNLIKEKVEKRFVFFEKQKFIRNYIKKLYAENDIEVKNQDNR
jgi:hypothetical protein